MIEMANHVSAIVMFTSYQADQDNQPKKMPMCANPACAM